MKRLLLSALTVFSLGCTKSDSGSGYIRETAVGAQRTPVHVYEDDRGSKTIIKKTTVANNYSKTKKVKPQNKKKPEKTKKSANWFSSDSSRSDKLKKKKSKSSSSWFSSKKTKTGRGSRSGRRK